MVDKGKAGRPKEESYILRIDILEEIANSRHLHRTLALFFEEGDYERADYLPCAKIVRNVLKKQPASIRTAKALARYLNMDENWLLDHACILREPVESYCDDSLGKFEGKPLKAKTPEEYNAFALARAKRGEDLDSDAKVLPIEGGKVQEPQDQLLKSRSVERYDRWDRPMVWDAIENAAPDAELCLYTTYPAEADELHESLKIWLDRAIEKNSNVIPKLKVLYMSRADPVILKRRMRLREDCEIKEHLEKMRHAYTRMETLKRNYADKADIEFYTHHSHVFKHFYIIGEKVIYAADLWPHKCSTLGTMDVIRDPSSIQWRLYREAFDCVFKDAIRHKVAPTVSEQRSSGLSTKKVNSSSSGRRRNQDHPDQTLMGF